MGMADNNTESGNHQPPKNVVFSVEERSPDVQGSPARNGSKIRKDFQRSQHHFSPREQRRKLCGVRQLRRCENLNFLLSQGEKDTDESGEVDFVDLVSHHNSPFQELFMEPDKMSAWSSFVDSSEEEQQRLLAAVSKAKLHDIFHNVDDNDPMLDDEDLEDFEQVGSTAGVASSSAAGTNGSRYFARTANECFQRINRNLRGFLRQNRFPTGELRHLEDELVAFFVEWPSSVYVAHLPDGYRRLMLHAVSQYLDLDARSYDVPGAVRLRQTQVENLNKHGKGSVFVPPPTPLATFINENKATVVMA